MIHIYIYTISAGCYEDWCYRLVSHDAKITPDEFVAMVKSVCNEDTNIGDVAHQLCVRYGFTLVDTMSVHLWDYAYDCPSDGEVMFDVSDFRCKG